MDTTHIKSLYDIHKAFPTEESCIEFLENLWWPTGAKSPFASDAKVYKYKNGKYKCSKTKKYFNIRTGTLFDNTKIELRKWFMAQWLVTNHKKGISSIQLAKDIDVTQKTAWFMLQRIRACYGIENNNTLDGTVEADETFYGGKNKNRHKDKKVERSRGRAFKDKTPILGLLQRDGKMNAFVIPDGTSAPIIQPLIKKYVKPRSTLISDDWSGYNGLENRYDQFMVKHTTAAGHYSHPDPTIHTNNVEGAWKHMKNSMRDNYNHVSRKHMQKYVDEFVFRWNTKTDKEGARFVHLLKHSEVRTTYKQLVYGNPN